jgi:opacity protein-like surface antigen
MAGVSYDLNDQIKVDLGYKYSNVEAGDIYGYSADAAALGASGSQSSDGGFERHEVRLGMRLSTW